MRPKVPRLSYCGSSTCCCASAGPPASPVSAFLSPKLRRRFRRSAERLRLGKAQPRYGNLHNSEELADICERTAERDEILEQTARDLVWINRELDRVVEENDPEAGRTLERLIIDAKRSAEEQGPGSEAEERYRQLLYLASPETRDQNRRRRTPSPDLPWIPDPSIDARNRLIAAELLPSPPSSEEPVITIPPDGHDSGRRRILLRIGIGQASWIGSFECGHTDFSTVSMMPNGKHLFVSADGAGYIVGLKSHTLVERLGTDIAGATRDKAPTLFVLNHDGTSLEAFGKSGRLWKTAPISAGGFRNLALIDGFLAGEAQHLSGTGWVLFAIKVATGEVRFREGA
jgi:hypothetical protein